MESVILKILLSICLVLLGVVCTMALSTPQAIVIGIIITIDIIGLSII